MPLFQFNITILASVFKRFHKLFVPLLGGGMGKNMKILRIVPTLLCAAVILWQSGADRLIYAEATDTLAVGSSLVAENQEASSGGYLWPGLDVTWLDFGPEINYLAHYGIGSGLPESGEGTFSLSLAGTNGSVKTIRFDATGRVLVAPGYNVIDDFYDSLAMVTKYIPSGDRMPFMEYGWVDKNGNEVITPGKFNPGRHHFSGGLCGFVVFIEDGETTRHGFIDKSGNIVIPAEKFIEAGAFFEELAWAKDSGLGKYGFIDNTGAYIIEPIYDHVSDFREGLAYAEKDGLAGYIDKDGMTVIPFEFLPVEICTYDPRFFNGLAVARGQSGDVGYIDKSGEFVIEAMYVGAYPFTGEAAWVTYNNPVYDRYCMYLINRENTRLTPLWHYTTIDGETMQSGIVRVGDASWFYGALNKYGAEVIPLSMVSITPAVNGYSLIIPPQTGDKLVVGILKVSEAFETNQKSKLIKVKIDGQSLEIKDTDPIIENDRTMVPLRVIFEALGAELIWDEENESAIATKDGKEIKITIGKNTAMVNGNSVELDAPAFIKNSRTMVPVRFIAESFDMKVDWDAKTQTVLIER